MKQSKSDVMGLDQYGHTYHSLGAHPRKALLSRLARKSAAKMYIDRENGTAAHVGYIIAGLWITLYRVSRFEKPA